MIINNRQINIWRGLEPPPTIYHLWLYNESELKLYNGTGWVTIVDSINIAERLNELADNIQSIQENFANTTVNGKYIKDNPILNTDDILNTRVGNYIKNESISNTLNTIDKLLVTQIID